MQIMVVLMQELANIYKRINTCNLLEEQKAEEKVDKPNKCIELQNHATLVLRKPTSFKIICHIK